MNDHTPRHDPTPRRRTINSKGEIVDRPYGVSRWASPKTYDCAHSGCVHPAKVLKAANAHPVAVGTPTNAHNCCGTHEASS